MAGEFDTGDLSHELTHKLGPLPAWAWGLVAAGGIYLYQRRRTAKTAPVSTGVADPSAEASGITPAYDASFGSVLADSSYGSAGGQTIPVPLTPGQFDTMLSDYLSGHGFTPSEVASATPAPTAVMTPPAEVPAVTPTSTVTPVAPVYPTPINPAAPYLNSGGVQSDGVSPVYTTQATQPVAYDIGGQTVYVPTSLFNTGAYSADLASASDPYLASTWKDAAISRLQAAGVI